LVEAGKKRRYDSDVRISLPLRRIGWFGVPASAGITENLNYGTIFCKIVVLENVGHDPNFREWEL